MLWDPFFFVDIAALGFLEYFDLDHEEKEGFLTISIKDVCALVGTEREFSFFVNCDYWSCFVNLVLSSRFGNNLTLIRIC